MQNIITYFQSEVGITYKFRQPDRTMLFCLLMVDEETNCMLLV